MASINDFHVHVYFDQDTIEQARKLCELARDKFSLHMGRVHEKNVGPHPRWSCQLLVQPEIFGALLGWITLNRGGLTVFTHPNTGDDLADHRDRAIWMGEILDLDLSGFS